MGRLSRAGALSQARYVRGEIAFLSTGEEADVREVVGLRHVLRRSRGDVTHGWGKVAWPLARQRPAHATAD